MAVATLEGIRMKRCPLAIIFSALLLLPVLGIGQTAPGQQPAVSADGQAAKCLKQFIDCVNNMGKNRDSNEIREPDAGKKAWDACATAGNLCADAILKPPAPVVQKDDCNVNPSSAEVGRVIQSYMESGNPLPDSILKLQQMQKNAFDLEIKCEQLKAARTPCK
jgi:hypothetical protein